MKTSCSRGVILVALGIVITGVAQRGTAAEPLGMAFTYQGQLLQGGNPTTGTCDLQFSLFDAASGGNRLGSPQTVGPVSVTDGLFTVQLNGGAEFGTNPFNGEGRWLQIGVSCPSSASPSFTVLAPRQDLTAAPYALYAPAAGSFTGSLSGDVTGTQSATHVAKINGSSLGSLGGATNGQVLTFNGSNWGPSSVVSSLTAGSGLSVSSSTGSITLSVPASGVTNTMLANSSVTVTAGTGLSGGGTVALGGTTTLNNAGVLSVGASAPLAVAGPDAQHPQMFLNGQVPLDHGGTGADNSNQARNNLSAAKSGANSDITSLSGITGNIVLPESTASTAGNIFKGDVPFIHNFPGDAGNTFVGVSAGNFTRPMTGGGANTALGQGALHANARGEKNTAMGLGALSSNTDGIENTAVGLAALSSNTIGHENTAVGAWTLNANTLGSNNVAVGQTALYVNTTGGNNTAVGAAALVANTDGTENTAVGKSALAANDGGSLNVALGALALSKNTAGESNTAVGHAALFNVTGNGNIGVGVNAGTEVVGGSNNIDIGSPGAFADSGTIRIGTSGIQFATFVAGIFNVTSSNGVPVLVNAAGQLGTASSSARFKEDIADIGDASSGLMRLRPVRFRYKHDIDPSGLEQYGLVAEEVATVYPGLVANDSDGHPYTVRYQFLAPMLLNEVQRQAREIARQREQIATLTARLEQVEATIAAQPGAPTARTAADCLGVPHVAAASF